MAVTLNHTLVNMRDKQRSAHFLAEILGLPTPPSLLGNIFAVVQVGDTSLDFIDSVEAIEPQHHAFLVTDPEFDQIFARIRERGLSYWRHTSRASQPPRPLDD